MPELSVKINDREVKDLLAHIQQRLGHMKPAMSLVGEIVQESIEHNFEAGGILVRSGKAGGLMGSIAYNAGDDQVVVAANKASAATLHYGAAKGSFGTVEVTAKIREHYRTTKKGKRAKVSAHTRTRMQPLPWGDIPARPFMMVQTEDWDEMRDALRDYLLRSRT